MEKAITNFRDIEIENKKIHQDKRFISINNIDINKVVISGKVPFGKNSLKYFIGFKDSKK